MSSKNYLTVFYTLKKVLGIKSSNPYLTWFWSFIHYVQNFVVSGVLGSGLKDTMYLYSSWDPSLGGVTNCSLHLQEIAAVTNWSRLSSSNRLVTVLDNNTLETSVRSDIMCKYTLECGRLIPTIAKQWQLTLPGEFRPMRPTFCTFQLGACPASLTYHHAQSMLHPGDWLSSLSCHSTVSDHDRVNSSAIALFYPNVDHRTTAL